MRSRIAKEGEGLTTEEKIKGICETFGAASGRIEASPLKGKLAGSSDIGIHLDYPDMADHPSWLSLDTLPTRLARDWKTQEMAVDNAFMQYSPEIVAATKEAAMRALKRIEAEDNETARMVGLKPYKLISVEFSNDTLSDWDANLGWYYVILAIDPKTSPLHGGVDTEIVAIRDEGLSRAIRDGSAEAYLNGEYRYDDLSPVKETPFNDYDADFVFNNVAYSTRPTPHTFWPGTSMQERSLGLLEKELDGQGAETPGAIGAAYPIEDASRRQRIKHGYRLVATMEPTAKRGKSGPITEDTARKALVGAVGAMIESETAHWAEDGEDWRDQLREDLGGYLTEEPGIMYRRMFHNKLGLGRGMAHLVGDDIAFQMNDADGEWMTRFYVHPRRYVREEERDGLPDEQIRLEAPADDLMFLAQEYFFGVSRRNRRLAEDARADKERITGEAAKEFNANLDQVAKDLKARLDQEMAQEASQRDEEALKGEQTKEEQAKEEQAKEEEARRKDSVAYAEEEDGRPHLELTTALSFLIARRAVMLLISGILAAPHGKFLKGYESLVETLKDPMASDRQREDAFLDALQLTGENSIGGDGDRGVQIPFLTEPDDPNLVECAIFKPDDPNAITLHISPLMYLTNEEAMERLGIDKNAIPAIESYGNNIRLPIKGAVAFAWEAMRIFGGEAPDNRGAIESARAVRIFPYTWDEVEGAKRDAVGKLIEFGRGNWDEESPFKQRDAIENKLDNSEGLAGYFLLLALGLVEEREETYPGINLHQTHYDYHDKSHKLTLGEANGEKGQTTAWVTDGHDDFLDRELYDTEARNMVVNVISPLVYGWRLTIPMRELFAIAKEIVERDETLRAEPTLSITEKEPRPHLDLTYRGESAIKEAAIISILSYRLAALTLDELHFLEALKDEGDITAESKEKLIACLGLSDGGRHAIMEENWPKDYAMYSPDRGTIELHVRPLLYLEPSKYGLDPNIDSDSYENTVSMTIRSTIGIIADFFDNINNRTENAPNMAGLNSAPRLSDGQLQELKREAIRRLAKQAEASDNGPGTREQRIRGLADESLPFVTRRALLVDLLGIGEFDKSGHPLGWHGPDDPIFLSPYGPGPDSIAYAVIDDDLEYEDEGKLTIMLDIHPSHFINAPKEDVGHSIGIDDGEAISIAAEILAPRAEDRDTQGEGEGEGSHKPEGQHSINAGISPMPESSPRDANAPAEDARSQAEPSAPAKAAAADFHYPEGWEPTTGSDKERFQANIEAIRTLKAIEAGETEPSREAQETLSHYVGWGGLSMYFDPAREDLAGDREALKGLLTEEEYESARASVTDSFYTPRFVIEAIYSALERMGFHGGRVLEPAMGIGNFFSAMDPALADKCSLHGVELDPISGRIARILHPSADIQICGIQDAGLASGSFDAIIGNVPFGDYKPHDEKLKGENFLIHDYFFAKALDLCAPGGAIAFVTSMGTMDKKSANVRKYISDRADFLGAIRLPNETFKSSANTEVTSDIIFLRKKPQISVAQQEFETVEEHEGFTINSYFAQNMDMIMGYMVFAKGQFGRPTQSCVLYRPQSIRGFEQAIEPLLKRAIERLPEGALAEAAEATPEMEADAEADEEDTPIGSIPAPAGTKDRTFAIVGGKAYFREGTRLIPQGIKGKALGIVSSLCDVRNALHDLFNAQLSGCTDEELREAQGKLGEAYDAFLKKYGPINGPDAQKAFGQDIEYRLLRNLEKTDEETGDTIRADVFTKRVFSNKNSLERTETAEEALNFTVADKGGVDFREIISLYGRPFEETAKELSDMGLIFLNPERHMDGMPMDGWETSEEYLSGNIREKLAVAESAAKGNPWYERNASALRDVMPRDLGPEEIDVGIGANWISAEDYGLFMGETFDINRHHHKINYSEPTNTYFIENKSSVSINDTLLMSTYGTGRMSGLEIFEDLLNMKPIVVRDQVPDPSGLSDSKKSVINTKETMLANDKARAIQERFKKWVWEDPDRRAKYAKTYNERFNSIRAREYDGSGLTFPGKNESIELRPHQKNAVARIVRGGNTLLGHCVGAGKSFEMAAAAMELKRLGLANKTMIVVPNHLVEQMAGEFLTLYPNANVLVTHKEDLKKSNRKNFLAMVSLGNFDAIIIAQSTFSTLPLSKEREEAYIQREIREMRDYLHRLRNSGVRGWTIKNIERAIKKMEERLEKRRMANRNDDMLTFEELGVDCLMVDEAHTYKNLDFFTKMGNVSGINPDGSERSFDMSMKIKYINELRPGRNVVFATGTPVSNTMCEMYIMQKYLQPDLLKKMGIGMFDAWAANFGEVTTEQELDVVGNKTRLNTRFAKFKNIPELVTAFHMVADVKTIDDLPFIDVPRLSGGGIEIVKCEPNELTKACMEDFVRRAGEVRSGNVNPKEDNMLKICSDAKKLSTDARLLFPDAEPDPEGKLHKCAENAYRIYKETEADRLTQVIFCDVGVPKGKDEDGKFCTYQCIKDDLVALGVPADEVCFIHDAKNDKEKDKMFEDVRNGTKRIIIGSTEKMGTGTNIQDRLVAMHEIDVPWKPAEVTQREGRILRQGNRNREVSIFRYVTEGTFDAYNWAIIENKQKFISQVMVSGDVPRESEDIDAVVLNYAQMKAAASGSPLVQEKVEVDAQVNKLKILKRSFEEEKYRLMDSVQNGLPESIEATKKRLAAMAANVQIRDSYAAAHADADGSVPFRMTIGGKEVTETKDAGAMLLEQAKKAPISGKTAHIGEFHGFSLGVRKNINTLAEGEEAIFVLSDKAGVGAERAVYANLDSDIGSVTRLRNAVGKGLDDAYDRLKEKLESEERNLETAKAEIGAEFQHEEELNRLLKRQDELFLLLSGPQQESQEAPADYNLETKIAKVASANEGADPFRPCARRGR